MKKIEPKKIISKKVSPKVKILYEDDNILAVDKPAGLLTHNDGRSDEKTLSDWLVKKFPQAKGVGEAYAVEDEGEKQGEIDRSGIVHRLDKDTSGVILLAKTREGFECLKEQFQNHTIKKMYQAIVVGKPREARGIIDVPIGKDPADFRARRASYAASGEIREARTQYFVKASKTISKGKTAKSGTEVYSLVQAMPQTGRTHQIRVHFKAIGHPIAADRMYGNAKNALGMDRTALHSYAVEFHNCEGETVRIEAPYPEDFAAAVEKLK